MEGSANEALLLVQVSIINIGLFFSIVFVFMMQPGFMLLEVGSVSRRNAVNDVYKNALDLAVGGIAFWFVGYDILTGDSIIWDWLQSFGLTQQPTSTADNIKPASSMDFLFHLAFASTAATICSGAVTARMSPHSYMIFAAFFTGLIYPIVAFLVWNEQSVLHGVFRDFAGAVVVHSVGAAGGLAGTLLLGPRIGYNGYDPLGLGQERLFKLAKLHAPHSLPLAALGVFLLLLGWFGFNGGTLLATDVRALPPGADAAEALDLLMTKLGSVLVATFLSACACAAMVAALNVLLDEDLNLLDTLNGFVAGAVAATATADLLTPGQAVLAGAAAAFVFRLSRRALVLMSVDDPVAAISAHGLTGVFGAAVVGLVADDASTVLFLSQITIGIGIFCGVLIASFAGFKLADWIQRLASIASGRCSFGSGIGKSLLRIDHRTEIKGMDLELHGQEAYGPGTSRGPT